MGDKQRNINILIKAKNEATAALESTLSSLTSLKGLSIAAGAAAAYMTAAFALVTKAAMAQEDADVRLAAALASIGQNTAANRAHLSRFIAQLEDVTGVEDETIASTVALLAQLGQLSGEGLEKATKTALDLAAALGMDLHAAATLVAKAAQGNTTALSRYGIVLDDTIPKTERGAAALRLLEQRFGGAAEAAGSTLTVAMRRIANQFDNLEQAIGKVVVENEAFRALLAIINDLLKESQGWVEGNTSAFSMMVTWVAKATIAFLKFGLEVANAQARQAEMILTTAQAAAALASLASVAPALTEKIFGVGGDLAKGMAKGAADVIVGLQKMKNVAGGVSDSTAAAIAAIEAELEKLSKGAFKAGQTFKNSLAGDGGAGDAIQKLGEEATTALPPLGALDSLLEVLGLQTLPQVEQSTRDVDAALTQIQDDFEAGLISAETRDALLTAVTEVTRQLPTWKDEIQKAAEATKQLLSGMDQVAVQMTGEVQNSILSVSDTLVAAAFGADVAWKKFLKSLIVGLAQALARAVLLEFVLGAISFGGSKVAGAAAGAGGGAITGVSGLGGVLEYFSPAQGVLPTEPTGGVAVRGASSTEPGAGPSPSGLMQMFNKIEPIRNREAEVIDLLEDMSRLVERRGYRLVASQVVA